MTPSDSQPFDDLLDLGIATAFGMSAGRTATGSSAAPTLEPAGPRAETLVDLPSRVGKYQVVELVAQGGMGVVARARDGELERDVAIKFLRHSLSANSALQCLFRHEARVMGALEHPGIVAIRAVPRQTLHSSGEPAELARCTTSAPPTTVASTT